MFYRVTRAFINIDGSFLHPGDVVKCDLNRARQLIRNGLIGQTADVKTMQSPEVKQQETAEEKTPKRKYRRRMK